jgi:hypothetical protein
LIQSRKNEHTGEPFILRDCRSSHNPSKRLSAFTEVEPQIMGRVAAVLTRSFIFIAALLLSFAALLAC